MTATASFSLADLIADVLDTLDGRGSQDDAISAVIALSAIKGGRSLTVGEVRYAELETVFAWNRRAAASFTPTVDPYQRPAPTTFNARHHGNYLAFDASGNPKMVDGPEATDLPLMVEKAKAQSKANRSRTVELSNAAQPDAPVLEDVKDPYYHSLTPARGGDAESLGGTNG